MMWKWIKRNNKHFIIIEILAVYLLLANPIEAKFFIKEGKPVGSNVQLPESSTDITYSLVELRPVVVDGESLYELKGFAFLKAKPTQTNRITILLNEGNQNIAYATSSVQFPDMIQSYSGYKPGMDQAEFSMLLSKQVLKAGTYQIGILLEDLEGTSRSYVLTSSSIYKTPNTLSFIPGK